MILLHLLNINWEPKSSSASWQFSVSILFHTEISKAGALNQATIPGPQAQRGRAQWILQCQLSLKCSNPNRGVSALVFEPTEWRTAPQMHRKPSVHWWPDFQKLRTFFKTTISFKNLPFHFRSDTEGEFWRASPWVLLHSFKRSHSTLTPLLLLPPAATNTSVPQRLHSVFPFLCVKECVLTLLLNL